MMFRSVLVLTASVALVGATACSVETEEHTLDSTQQPMCPVGGCVDPGDDPIDTIGPTTYSCKCGTIGPNGGFLSVNDQGQCIESTKKCCPNPKYPTFCPPGRLISVWNPCYGSTPYLRCNSLGSCYCSAYP